MGWGFQSMAAGVTLVAVMTAAPAQAQTPPAPVAPAARTFPVIVVGQRWEVEPTPAFPERARTSGVLAGETLLNCGVAPNRALQDCSILRETPGGAGFGQSALRAMWNGRLTENPQLSSWPNARVEITVRFADGQPGRATLGQQDRIQFTSPPR